MTTHMDMESQSDARGVGASIPSDGRGVGISASFFEVVQEGQLWCFPSLSSSLCHRFGSEEEKRSAEEK